MMMMRWWYPAKIQKS